MNDFFHFNALPETAIYYPSSNTQNLKIIIPLLTDSKEALLIPLRSTIQNGSNGEILDLFYIIAYKPIADSDSNIFKFLNLQMDIDRDFSEFRLIRHKVVRINIPTGLESILTDTPLESLIRLNNIIEVPNLSIQTIIENPNFIGDNPSEVIEKLSNGEFLYSDSCTIPPR